MFYGTWDPETGRWLSTDPALGKYMAGTKKGEGGIYNQVNFNLCHHSNNNPIKYIDSGEFYEGDHDGILCHDGTTFKEYLFFVVFRLNFVAFLKRW